MHGAVREAGTLARQLFNGSITSWTKDDGTPVSDADMAVDELLKQLLMSDRADYGWLSEETEDDLERLNTRRVWVVDPIDGTKSFLAGGNHWCISAALVEDGRPVLGAVYLPLDDALYAARIGDGASLNGRPLNASPRGQLNGARLIAHRSIMQPSRWQRAWPEVELGMTTSLALRLCRVAEGEFDATLAVGSKCDWDLAAGDLIVHEAGGRVSNLEGEGLTYNKQVTRQRGLVASGGAMHEEIVGFSRGYRREKS